ncbi:hypothetical protein WJX77_010184 [Trebouxia sp. C0004]
MKSGPPRKYDKNLAKRLHIRALRAACKAIEQATNLAGDAAEPSQTSAFHWQKKRKGTKLEQTLPPAKRLAAAHAALLSLQAAGPLQVGVSRDGPVGRGTKRGTRDAAGGSTGQTHTHTSRRISRAWSDGKPLAQGGSLDVESAPQAAAKEVELAVLIDKQR